MPELIIYGIPPYVHMWFTIVLILGAMVAYSSDKIPLELSSVTVFSLLLLFFYFFPLTDELGRQKISTINILEGFANPALIAVIGLLIIGQAVVQTGALNEVSNIILKLSRNNAIVSIVISLIFVMVTSAILNNTPVVVIFIPILAALAKNVNISVSKIMIPLSYVAILGGMMTLIGSSTNLLVSGTLEKMGMEPLNFFDFTIPGSVLALVGAIYVVTIAPRLLPDRASFAKSLVGDNDERQFIAQIEINRESDFVGKELEGDNFPDYKDISVKMLQRGEHAYLPPFDDGMAIRSNDIIILSATKKDIADILSKQPTSLLQNMEGGSEVADDPDSGEIKTDTNMAEVVITPASRMVGRNLEQIGFYHNHHCVVLGIQRQSRIIRAKVSEIRLAAGDVLLVMGKHKDIVQLQESKDLLFLEWSNEEIHSGNKAKQAGLILLSVVTLAALDIVPIAISSFVGATLVILAGCLNVRQARRAIDSQVVLIVAASLALGVALQETGGASYIAHALITVMEGNSPIFIMSALFILVAIVTNVLSNNASAVLFTPIAVEAAIELGVAPEMFIFAVIFASNCSFVTPIGYQTNLLVMGPGHYKFSDYMRSGLPLAILMWITYTAFAYFYF